MYCIIVKQGECILSSNKYYIKAVKLVKGDVIIDVVMKVD